VGSTAPAVASLRALPWPLAAGRWPPEAERSRVILATLDKRADK
jgi:hypothetical protein